MSTLPEVATATFGSVAPELFSMASRNKDVRDVCNVAASLISPSELSLIKRAVAIPFFVT